MQSDKTMKGHLTMLRGIIRRWYFRVLPHYRRLDLQFVTWTEGDEMLRKNEGWRLAIPEEDYNRCLGWVYLERRERITE